MPASKSESNRALIIQALARQPIQLHNVAKARDTQLMHTLLYSPKRVVNVIDAGTTMRFLTAFFCIKNQEKILTGTLRMCKRPIKILVEALKALGGKIDYVHTPRYPTLHIHGMKKQKANTLAIDASVSSQYISALLMVAPVLPQGLTLHLKGAVYSKPYIFMTLAMMRHFGIHATWQNRTIHITAQSYQTTDYTIAADWTSASYWYSFMALHQHNDARIKLLGLKKKSLQGDSAIAHMMTPFGVKTTFLDDGVVLEKSASVIKNWEKDFTDCPDLAPTCLVICAARGITCVIKGIESLRIKETDRITALQRELAKLGAQLTEISLGHWKLYPAAEITKSAHWIIETYQDHRMAMAFAPLAMLGQVCIENYKVVKKSYPHFWKDMAEMGFQLVE